MTNLRMEASADSNKLQHRCVVMLHDGCTAPLNYNSGWVGSGQEWTLASACALCLPPIIVQVFRT